MLLQGDQKRASKKKPKINKNKSVSWSDKKPKTKRPMGLDREISSSDTDLSKFNKNKKLTRSDKALSNSDRDVHRSSKKGGQKVKKQRPKEVWDSDRESLSSAASSSYFDRERSLTLSDVGISKNHRESPMTWMEKGIHLTMLFCLFDHYVIFVVL